MNKTILLCAAVAAWIIYQANQASDYDPQAEDLLDSTMTTFDQATGLFMTSPVQNMTTSLQMLSQMKRRESLSLTPYNLGDGGWTIGYGHFEKTREALPTIRNRSDADAVFAQDVRDRAEKWVKLYITVPLSQNQFDALVSIAFNMSPQSFKKFAAEVNAGNGIDDIAYQSVAWVRTGLQNGIRNRRNDELQVFNEGIYA